MKTKVKTIDIQAKEWFDKINGNSYFAGIITINFGMKSERTIKMPFQYGYKNQYENQAKAQLFNLGLLPAKPFKMNNIDSRVPSNMELREMGIIIRSSKQENCLKRDVKAYGE